MVVLFSGASHASRRKREVAGPLEYYLEAPAGPHRKVSIAPAVKTGAGHDASCLRIGYAFGAFRWQWPCPLAGNDWRQPVQEVSAWTTCSRTIRMLALAVLW